MLVRRALPAGRLAALGATPGSTTGCYAHPRPPPDGQLRPLPTMNEPRTAGRPNILWVSVEDINPLLGCYGDRYARTPNLDALAADGIRYTNAHSMAPVCSVSRAAIITGVVSFALGTHHHRSTIAAPEHLRLLPAYLRDAGYFTSNCVKTDYNLAGTANAQSDAAAPLSADGMGCLERPCALAAAGGRPAVLRRVQLHRVPLVRDQGLGRDDPGRAPDAAATGRLPRSRAGAAAALSPRHPRVPQGVVALLRRGDPDRLPRRAPRGRTAGGWAVGRHHRGVLGRPRHRHAARQALGVGAGRPCAVDRALPAALATPRSGGAGGGGGGTGHHPRPDRLHPVDDRPAGAGLHAQPPRPVRWRRRRRCRRPRGRRAPPVRGDRPRPPRHPLRAGARGARPPPPLPAQLFPAPALLPVRDLDLLVRLYPCLGPAGARRQAGRPAAPDRGSAQAVRGALRRRRRPLVRG